jgi:hypothetical protein
MFIGVLLKPEKQPAEKEPEQRKAIFMTKCKIAGKCCNLIVDGGSTGNLVFTKVIQKLKLECKSHPTPYRVAWLQC